MGRSRRLSVGVFSDESAALFRKNYLRLPLARVVKRIGTAKRSPATRSGARSARAPLRRGDIVVA
jgi:hypothetical protein